MERGETSEQINTPRPEYLERECLNDGRLFVCPFFICVWRGCERMKAAAACDALHNRVHYIIALVAHRAVGRWIEWLKMHAIVARCCATENASYC